VTEPLADTEALAWILGGGLLMAAVAMVGAVAAALPAALLERLLLPLVALAAGSLLGGATFLMIPRGAAELPATVAAAWGVAGFTVFLALELFLHWHHDHGGSSGPRPVVALVLLGDGLHNFLGGLAIASTFLLDPRAGIVAWIAALAHEVPQELGDFGVLVHGGLRRRTALLANFLSALTFPLGALLAWSAAQQLDVAGLVLFGAGNFVYIAASDLIPEIKAEPRPLAALRHFGFFLCGLGLTAGVAVFLKP
jgi:zinc and cadmium transporter